VFAPLRVELISETLEGLLLKAVSEGLGCDLFERPVGVWVQSLQRGLKIRSRICVEILANEAVEKMGYTSCSGRDGKVMQILSRHMLE
jgi:hypothetical protein